MQLPDVTAAHAGHAEARLLYLDPRQLQPDDENVRRDTGDLEGLAASLRRYGVLQPLGVAPVDGRQQYRVVYGNRRREAAILAGLEAVPCLPVTLPSNGDQLVAQLLENMQRRDLNDMEKAEGLARLRRQVAAEMGQDAKGEQPDARVAEMVGLAPRTVRRYLALRELPPDVRDLLAEENLTVTQAQHLAQLPTGAMQSAVAERAVSDDWTAAQISRVCAALARSPGLALDAAVDAAGAGWETVERLGPRVQAEAATPAQQASRPAPRPRATEPLEADADLWLEDATGAPTPEATGEANPFSQDGLSDRARQGFTGPSETADGHKVFRIRTLAAFCDEVDRLARCVQDGDLARSARADATAPVRLGLAVRQLAFVLKSVEGLAG